MASEETESSAATGEPVPITTDDRKEKMEVESPATNEAAAASSSTTDGASGDAGETSEINDNTPKEIVEFKVIYNKKKYDISLPLDSTVLSFKEHLEKLTEVPIAMQKIMYKGRMSDEGTLRDKKVTKSSKIMLIGSTVTDVLAVSAPDPKVLKAEMKAEEAATKEPLSTLKPHKTILEKYGKPEEVVAGIVGLKEPLPHVPLSGMYNKSGGKVRLTFKLEQDQLWIGTKERTDKIPMGSIKAVVSEPLADNPGHHMMGIQLGPTEASRYWVYWVPAQYVEAIKDAVLGKFQFF